MNLALDSEPWDTDQNDSQFGFYLVKYNFMQMSKIWYLCLPAFSVTFVISGKRIVLAFQISFSRV